MPSTVTDEGQITRRSLAVIPLLFASSAPFVGGQEPFLYLKRSLNICADQGPLLPCQHSAPAIAQARHIFFLAVLPRLLQVYKQFPGQKWSKLPLYDITGPPAIKTVNRVTQ